MATTPAPASTPLVRKTVVDMALEELRVRILHGRYAEGTTLLSAHIRDAGTSLIEFLRIHRGTK